MLLIRLFYHAASCTECRMWRALSLCDTQSDCGQWRTPRTVCHVGHTCRAAARTQPPALTDLQQTYREYRVVSVWLWTDRQTSVEGLGWPCPAGTDRDRLELVCDWLNCSVSWHVSHCTENYTIRDANSFSPNHKTVWNPKGSLSRSQNHIKSVTWMGTKCCLSGSVEPVSQNSCSWIQLYLQFQ
jgi:hypothetical protein